MIAISIVVISSGCRETNGTATPTLPTDRDRMDLARTVLLLEDVEFSEDELIAFDRSAKVIKAILNADEAPPLIEILQPNQPATEVPFEQIKEYIRAGDVVKASQNHSNHVEVLTRDGQRLTSTQPKIDTILKLIDEVDPKSLFIEVWTE